MKYYLPLLLLTPFSAHAHPEALPHVHHASHHLMSLTIELLSPNFIGVQIFTSLAQKISKSGDSSRARALHVHNAPQHPKSCTSE